MATYTEDVEEFYHLLNQLSLKLGGAKYLSQCNGRMPFPTRGVYFFFERDEKRTDNQTLRVVRIGTHAVRSGSKATLWNRLRTHRGTQAGNGNHRGSIFRRHVGLAMIKRDNISNFPDWGKGASASKIIKQGELEHEKRVSTYIGEMPFLWVKVDDEPSKDSHRAVIERNAIALLAGEDGQSPIDKPSENWLGLHSDREKIRLSGLWNLNHVGQVDKPIPYDPDFLQLFKEYIEAM